MILEYRDKLRRSMVWRIAEMLVLVVGKDRFARQCLQVKATISFAQSTTHVYVDLCILQEVSYSPMP